MFTQAEGTGPRYPDFNQQMKENLSDNISKITGNVNPVLDNMREVRKEMEPVIYAEDFRTHGAKEVYDKIFDECEERIDKMNKDTPPNEFKQVFNMCTEELPWAGTGGKSKFKGQVNKEDYKDVIKDDPPKMETGEWFDFTSPVREDERGMFHDPDSPSIIDFNK